MHGDLNAPASGKGRAGLILTGHDHAGCDVWHFIPRNSSWSNKEEEEAAEEHTTQWAASRWKDANHGESHTGVREVTLRSMMGDYGGNAGLLSVWFDYDRGEWQYDINMCGLNLLLWWTVHVIDLATIGLMAFNLVMLFHQSPRAHPKGSHSKLE
jgi:hypothetical protein